VRLSRLAPAAARPGPDGPWVRTAPFKILPYDAGRSGAERNQDGGGR